MRKLMWMAFIGWVTLAGAAQAESHGGGLLNLTRPESEAVSNNPFHALNACYNGRIPATSPAPIEPPSSPNPVPQPPVPPTQPKPKKEACEEGLKGRIQVGGWVHGNEISADSGHYALQAPPSLREKLSKVDGQRARLSGELELKKDGDTCRFIVNVTSINKGKKLSDYCKEDCASKYYAFANVTESCWVPSHDDKPVSFRSEGKNLCEARRNLCELIRGDATFDSVLPDPDQYDFVCHVKDVKKGPVALTK